MLRLTPLLVVATQLCACHLILPLGEGTDSSGLSDGTYERRADGASSEGSIGDGQPDGPMVDLGLDLQSADGLPVLEGGHDSVLNPDLPAPTGRWSKGIGTGGGDVIHAMAVDVSGNVYVAGELGGTMNLSSQTLNLKGASDILVLKFGQGGALLWAKNFGGTSTDVGRGIALDGNSLYVTGEVEGVVAVGTNILVPQGDADIVLLRLDASTGDPSGSWSWGSAENDRGRAVAVDQGTVYIAGDVGGTVQFGGQKVNHKGLGDPFVAAIQSNGSALWAKSDGANGVDHGYGVAVGGGAVWAVGVIWNQARELWVRAYDAGGGLLHQGNYGGAGDVEGHAVAVDGAGNAYVAGEFGKTLTVDTETVSTTSTNHGLLVGSFTKAGQARWLKSLGGGGTKDSEGWGITHTGNAVVVTGSFEGTPTLGTTTLQNKGLADIFIGSFADSTGGSSDAGSWGGSKVDRGYAIGVNGSKVYVAGRIGGPVNFGQGAVSFSAGIDGFVARVRP